MNLNLTSSAVFEPNPPKSSLPSLTKSSNQDEIVKEFFDGDFFLLSAGILNLGGGGGLILERHLFVIRPLTTNIGSE